MPQAIALDQAISILADTRRAVAHNQAVWSMINHAQIYLEKQMTEELHK